MIILLRLFLFIWLLGFVVLGLAATSSYMFSTEAPAERQARWSARLTTAMLWPIAVLSSSGRARLRRG